MLVNVCVLFRFRLVSLQAFIPALNMLRCRIKPNVFNLHTAHLLTDGGQRAAHGVRHEHAQSGPGQQSRRGKGLLFHCVFSCIYRSRTVSFSFGIMIFAGFLEFVCSRPSVKNGNDTKSEIVQSIFFNTVDVLFLLAHLYVVLLTASERGLEHCTWIFIYLTKLHKAHNTRKHTIQSTARATYDPREAKKGPSRRSPAASWGCAASTSLVCWRAALPSPAR